MLPCDTLILADWCIPVEPPDTVLNRHAVVIDEGRIKAILPRDEALGRYQPGALVDRPGHVLIPGLVNAHTHAAMCLFRGIADDMPLEQWLGDGVWPAEKRWVDAEFVRDGTRLAIAEMLLGGVTCFSDQYFFPEVVAETAIELHMRAMIGTPVIEFANAWAQDAAQCLGKGTDLVHDPYADHPLVSTCFAPHSVGTVSDETFRELRILADQLDAPVQIHLHESAGEIEASVARSGRRPIQRLDDFGLLNASLMAVHAVHVTPDEIRAFAGAGVTVAHCPRSNLKLADGMAPVTAMLDAGIDVAIGTDGAASNNVLDVMGETRTAALMAKAVAGDASALPAAGALRMATLQGARVLGLDERIGSIEVGKEADLACVDMRHPNCQPLYDPVSQLIYAASAQQVSDVWIAGRRQVDNGALTRIDRDDLLRRTGEWQERIAAQRKRT